MLEGSGTRLHSTVMVLLHDVISIPNKSVLKKIILQYRVGGESSPNLLCTLDCGIKHCTKPRTVWTQLVAVNQLHHSIYFILFLNSNTYSHIKEVCTREYASCIQVT